MAYLLDTNIASELRKSSCHPNVSAWFDSVHGTDKHLSVLTIGELMHGIERISLRNDRRQAAHLQDWVNALLREYGSRIVPVTTEIALTWGRLLARHPLPPVDALLAATAMVNDWTLVTRNVKDVGRCGVRVLNPFEP